MRKHIAAAVAAASSAAVVAGGTLAYASTRAPAAPAEHAYYGCVDTNAADSPPRQIFNVRAYAVKCPAGSYRISWNKDQRGKLAMTAQMDVANIPTQLQYIGGTILQTTAGHGATNILQVFLPQGTYLVNANMKFDRSVSATDTPPGPDTYGYLAMWTGAAATDTFTSFDQGAGTFTTGPLPRMVNGGDVIDATASGSHVLVVPAGGEYLNVSAFAYNADESGGAYSGCVGLSGGANPCTSADLSEPGSVVVTNADLSVLRVE